MRKALVATILAATTIAIIGAPGPVAAQPVNSGRLTGPTGFCQFYEEAKPVVGTVVLATRQPARGGPGFRPVEARGAVYNLTPGVTYEVWLAELTIQDGQILGCSAQQIDSITPSRRVAPFRGSALSFTGSHVFQVFVTTSFSSFIGSVSEPIPLTVP
jgi:hypothetical protein